MTLIFLRIYSKKSNECFTLILTDHEKQRRDVGIIQSNFGEYPINHSSVNRSAPICLGTMITIL